MPSWTPCTRLEWAYFGATAVQALVFTSIQVTTFVVYLNWVNSSVYEVPVSFVVPLTLAVTTFGTLYQVILTLDAYRIKNNIQLLMQCICNMILMVATVLQYRQIKNARDRIIVGFNMHYIPFAKNDWKFWEHVHPGLITCMVVSCVCTVSMCILAFALHKEFVWAIYKQVSPDIKMRKRYTCYQIYLILLKFAPFFLIAFILVYDLIFVHYQEPEYSLTLALIPVSLIVVGLAVYFVRIESYIGMVIVLIGQIAQIAYLLNRAVFLISEGPRKIGFMADEMVFLVLVAILFYLCALVAAGVCFCNFGKGLKPIVLGQVQQNNGPSVREAAYYFQRLNHHVPPPPIRENQRFQLD